ncbi:dual oxidase maturation factor 1-like isoform X1 [Limulus polyphemus]|uniref:Dual oxidase maturation factor 1-like isoform X1 n=1 Tax=Limulus polyphemus TaxID=6850 RepID=A0ABM1TLE4_LIMPO|nr:dual oxidase maturation factor 1-like isoform X1 [Limulus polyphemus]
MTKQLSYRGFSESKNKYFCEKNKENQRRCPCVSAVLFSIFGYLVLVFCVECSYWLVSHSSIKSQYGARSGHIVAGDISVSIGFYDVTIRLKGGVSGNKTETVDIRHTFKWDDGYMKHQLKVALQQGLPFPVLTVLEYFIEDFGWTPRFCMAGRFVAALLSISLVFSIALLFLWYCGEVEGLHVGGSLSFSGVLIISSSVIYDVMMPKMPLTIRFQEGVLSFSYSWSFFLAFSVGFVSSALGILNMAASRDIYRPEYCHIP